MSDQATSGRPSPYRGILPFRYADRANFFGREREVSELAAKILLYRLVVLFGDSGSGKSSLINAGVVPRLELESFQPERLRVRPFKESPFLVERISSGSRDLRFLPSAFADFAHDGSSDSREVYCSLEGFRRALSSASREQPLVLIIDQFEELFTLFEPADHILQGRILDVIANVANQKDLPVKIVLGIREDFLGKLELISKEYPQVFDRRVRLGMLSTESARRAVIGPFERKDEFAAEISAETADVIIGELGQGTEYAGIHPTQLQIVCSRLWDQYAGEARVIASGHFQAMNGVKGILEGFLEAATSALSPGQKDLAYRVLGQLITVSGTRDVVSDAKLKSWRAQAEQEDDKALADVLGFLEERKLINRTPQHGMYYYEVSSEYLVAPIQVYNRERECREAEKKAAAAMAEVAAEAARTRELEQARLLAGEQTRLAEAERKRAEFEARTAKRLRWRWRMLLGLSIYGILAIIGLISLYSKADKAAGLAKTEAVRANDEAIRANQKAAELEKAMITAEANWKEAVAANLRITKMRTATLFQQAKESVDVVTDDTLIKQDALSRDPGRLESALHRRPSRIVFDVNMKELRPDQKIGKIYRFELFPVEKTVDGGLNSLAMITMLMDDPSFKKSIIAAGPESKFVSSYEGWGCLDNVVAVIEYRDPSRRAEVTIVKMCDILSKKYGKMQKR
ncbi:MAG: ATP-binding protein [Candidatus Aminicenantales bacterium]